MRFTQCGNTSQCIKNSARGKEFLFAKALIPSDIDSWQFSGDKDRYGWSIRPQYSTGFILKLEML